jgi:hypothetical protein
MSDLYELEKSVLEEILRQVPRNQTRSLREQIDGASVVSREKTGAGFFTQLRVGKTARSIEAKVIGDVRADIEGFDQPMLFLLFLRDGVIYQLEGATITDSTVGVDFSKIRFLIQPRDPEVNLDASGSPKP